jgi:transposase-like protein
MTQASSDDLRERVLGAVASGTSARAAARRFGIGAATAVAWADCQRQTGETTARRQAPRQTAYSCLRFRQAHILSRRLARVSYLILDCAGCGMTARPVVICTGCSVPCLTVILTSTKERVGSTHRS